MRELLGAEGSTLVANRMINLTQGKRFSVLVGIHRPDEEEYDNNAMNGHVYDNSSSAIGRQYFDRAMNYYR